MLPVFTSPFSLLFVFSLLIPFRCANHIEKLPNAANNMINQTCRTCGKLSYLNVSYDFCSSSLAAVPISHVSILGGLGLVAMELTVENATNTTSIISNLLQRNVSAPHCNSCLESCLELYTSVSTKLEECIGEYLSGQYDPVYLWVSMTMQATALCEGGFEGEGFKSPLSKENYALSQLCSIVLCIIDLISLGRSIEALNLVTSVST